MQWRICAFLVCVTFVATMLAWSNPQRRKGEEEVTQVLEAPQDPPAAILADSSRLSFQVSPLSSRGLLSQQVRDGLRALNSLNRRSQIVAIRAFVAGSADLRRVPALVSDLFTDRRRPIPVVTVVQVGALGLAGARVQMESIAVDRKPTMPDGIAFISGQPGKAAAAAQPVLAALSSGGLDAASVRKLTCFLNSTDHLTAARSSIAAAFPKAPAVFVQVRRDTIDDFVECEAIAAAAKAADTPTVIGVQPQGFSQVVVTGPSQFAFTSTQLAFGRREEDARLAFERLNKTLEGVGASLQTVIKSNVYPITGTSRDMVRKVRGDYYDSAKPPASTMLLFEGLASVDASFGIDVVAISSRK